MHAAAALETPSGRGRGRFSFVFKVLLALSLVWVADRLFYWAGWSGSTDGIFAGLLLLAALLAHPRLRRSPAALTAAAAALLFAFALFIDPSLLAAALFWVAASMAVLLTRNGFDDGWRWAKRLMLQWLVTPGLPWRDLARVRRARRDRRRVSFAAHLPVIGLPLIGTIVFLALFARANPLIGDALAGIDWAGILAALSPVRLVVWLVVATIAWSLLRPARVLLGEAPGVDEDLALPGVSPASVTLSLVAFNLLFALQNGLDLVFLWSGAPLPDGVTLADYAHRGAYPLIVTALLAALFVLVTLRPGSAMAEAPAIRRLVFLWIGQNVLLVASTMLRTLDYVDAYSLTELRIAALLWMALVAFGLVLICVRLRAGKSGAWLINANLLAAALLLAGCAFADLGAAAAAWNVRHAREAGGHGASLDLCYLDMLGEAALLPVIELEIRAQGRAPILADRLAALRSGKMAALVRQQAHWRSWTVRGARRLETAQRLAVEHRLPSVSIQGRDCGGVPLTAAARQ
ncbi:DUF4173 domain-containing protein [Sphingomonas parva]|uniref:DUF4173 domain-containing protein n=1 Tax=Sphingomonas parva TaxID=2555898 RepID=A0A4Y8ZQK5_9SPHN|nr:DUF4173 domain-containing protein [Sphingomonas parva]TFI56676.1 DUF4173 domain-containing protein [Sphingomonas parva]